MISVSPPSVLLLDKEGFEQHLSRHRQEIIRTITSLYERFPTLNITDSEVQMSLKAVLAKNNNLLVDIKRLTAEKEDRDDRLADTMMKLLSLEKKLDRSKSLTLQKIESQAMQRSIEEPQGREVQDDSVPSRPNSRVLP